MGLRSRVLRRIGALLGRPAATAPPPAAAAPPPPAAAAAPAPASAGPRPPPSASAPPAAAPAATPSAAPPPAVGKAPGPAAPPTPEEEAERAEKAVRHIAKTRRAMLKLLAESGGKASLGALHDHSERRYFIGHKKFSDMLEGMIADGVVDFDHGAGEAHLTDAGRAALEAPVA